MTSPRIAAAHLTTNSSYSSRSWAEREPPARSQSARICSFKAAADRTEPGATESGDMRTSVGAGTDSALPSGYSPGMWFITVAGRDLKPQPADSAACGLSAPVATRAMITMPRTMR